METPDQARDSRHQDAPVPSGAALKPRLRALLASLSSGLIERDVALRLALLAALAGEHLLLTGPPGTAKSELARRLQRAFRDAPYFERLLTRFSVPEELFGPLSLKALEQDRYERQVEGYMPAAAIAFIDEIFKANSAILNALLTLLNERLFHNGRELVATPLLCVIAASNELPADGELDALYDRFLLRLSVQPVSDAGFDALLDHPAAAHAPPPATTLLEARELADFRRQAARLPMSREARALLRDCRTYLQRENIIVSDRRWRKLAVLLRVAAASDGRPGVDIYDCWLLTHVLWNRPAQRPGLVAWFRRRIASRAGGDSADMEVIVASWEERLQRDRTRKEQATDREGRPLFRNFAGKTVTDARGPRHKHNADGQPLFRGRNFFGDEDGSNRGKGYTAEDLTQRLGSRDAAERHMRDPAHHLMELAPHAPVMDLRRFPPGYVESQCEQVDALVAGLQSELQAMLSQREHLRDIIATNLWIPADLFEDARSGLDEDIRTRDTWLRRLRLVATGLQALPLQVTPSGANAAGAAATGAGAAGTRAMGGSAETPAIPAEVSADVPSAVPEAGSAHTPL